MGFNSRQLSKIANIDMWLKYAEVKVLPQVLKENEVIHYLGQGAVRGQSEFIALTDERFMFLTKNKGKVSYSSLNLDRITDYKKKFSPKGELIIINIDKVMLDILAESAELEKIMAKLEELKPIEREEPAGIPDINNDNSVTVTVKAGAAPVVKAGGGNSGAAGGLEQLFCAYSEAGDGEAFFLQNDYTLGLNLRGRAWMKMGAAIGYDGTVKFRREGIAEKGIGNMLKKAVTGEGALLTKCEGFGRVFLGDYGKKVLIVKLDDEAITVNGSDVLAFEDSIKYDIVMMKRIAEMTSGGLFNVRLQGSGYVAITCHGTPVVMKVSPGRPVMTDPHATVAWSGNLNTSLKLDMSIGTFIGRASGETYQMSFEGNGFVVIQPFEE